MMKLIDVFGNVPIMIFGEEKELIDKIKTKIKKKSLSEREIYIADILVNKGVLKRVKLDNQLYFLVVSNNVIKD